MPTNSNQQPKSLTISQKQAKLYRVIQKLAPASLKSTYQRDDLIHDAFLDYLKKHPEYLSKSEPIDQELAKKLVYHRRISNDRPKYPTHRTSQFDAADLELIARNRLVFDEETYAPSKTYIAIRELFTQELTNRNLKLP